MNTRRYITGIFRLAMILFLSGGAMAALRVSAQSNLVIGVSRPTNAIPVNTTLTYSIFITNTTSFLISAISVTNVLPPSAQFVSAMNDPSNPGGVVNDGNITTFFLIQLPGFNIAEMSLTVRPLVAGSITNTISVFSPLIVSNVVAEIVNQVTNRSAAQADLAVSINLPTAPIVINDDLTYAVTVRNLGPDNASNVLLTNFIPGAIFRGTNQSRVNLGSLTNGAFKVFNVQVQPTNSGTLTFSASVGSDVTDTNTANNVATTNLVVAPIQNNILVAANVTPVMVFNPQDSLMEQIIRLSNVSATETAAAARVIVTGLAATNRLYNAVGTNDGNPYVVYAAPLVPGQSVDLIMQYVIKNRLPVAIDDKNYLAVPTSAFNVIAPTNYTFMITNIIQLPSQAWMIEFPATKGKTYTILYSSDFSAATLAAQPPVVAQADKVQWIDDGPPGTITHPTNAPARFYRVLLNP